MKYIDPDDKNASVKVPFGDIRVYKPENWSMKEVKPDIKNTYKFEAKLKISGYENLEPIHWDLTDRDIELYGEGNLEKMSEYLFFNFSQGLKHHEEVYLNHLRNAGGLF